jgi:glycosyltransferase involved in cell wall biosynthesis
MHDQKTKISILIPCYNAERWVGQAIESALAQTWPNKEVIVVDDGSTDGSRAVIESFGNTIRHEFGPNRGGNPCRNRLLELASGEWVQFLDADDELLPGKIETQLKHASRDIDVVYGGVTLQWWDDRRLRKTEISAPESNKTPIFHWMSWQLAHTGAVLWRKKSLKHIGGWNETYPCCQDNEVCMRGIQHGLKFSLSNDAGSLYRIWSVNSVCRRNLKQLVVTKTKLLDEMLDWLKTTGQISREHKKLAGKACFDLARCIAAEHPEDAFQYAEDRIQKGLFNSRIAPISFRIAYYILGYRLAETLASKRRQFFA